VKATVHAIIVSSARMEDDKEVDNNCDSEATPRPPVNDVKKSCTFFMTDKRRKCRMSALDGNVKDL